MLPALPISYATLEQYRLRLTDRVRAGAIGSELTQRKGQSLEFREYAPYMPGDDFRHIDWSASQRRHGKLGGHGGDYLVRRFLAEEQFRLLISLDTRATMRLPAGAPKRHIAAWIAEAVAWIALRSGHRVALHRLFGPADGGIQDLGATAGSHAGAKTIRAALDAIGADASEDAASEELNLNALATYLPPAAVWLIVTDLYFADMEQPPDFVGEQARQLARRIAAARDGLRWVQVVDLDSWPHERTLVEDGTHSRAWRIGGPNAQAPGERVQVDGDALTRIKDEIDGFRDHFLFQLCRMAKSDVSQWEYPGDRDISAERFFAEQFFEDTVIERLFVQRI